MPFTFMTLPSADNDLLILTPSLSRSPVEPLLSDLSEPASKFILFTVSVIWRLQTVVVCLIHELMQRRYAKTRTPNFCKVLRQHRPYWRYGCMTWILLEIYCSFQQWKDVENPLRIDSCRRDFGVLLFWYTVYFLHYLGKTWGARTGPSSLYQM